MPRLAVGTIVGLVGYCIRRKRAYPFQIDSPAYDRMYEPTYFTDITAAIESLFLPHVHRDAEAPGERLACALCGAHPTNHYFCNARAGEKAFAPARWPDGNHDPAPYPTEYWPKADDPPPLAARAPAICLHCVKRNWVMDEERIHGALIALERSADDTLEVEAAIFDIQEQYPSRVIRVGALERCTFCNELEHAVIKGRDALMCQPCFDRARKAMSRLFARLETEGRILDPPESM
jgi:hypothetical protein